MHQRLTPACGARQRGITLIESMIALVVAALGILGIVGVQMRTLTDTTTTVRRAQAIRLIEDLSERMKVNPNALLGISDYKSDYAKKASDYSGSDCAATACSADNLVTYDLNQWRKTVEQTLPGGQASLFFAPGEGAGNSNRRLLGVIIAWRKNEREDITDKNDKDAIDASKFLVKNDDGTTKEIITGTDAANACPDGFTCQLQYLPVSARCAPYGGAGSEIVYCS